MPARVEAGPLVEARGVGHAYNGRDVLTGVDVAVAPGEIVTLIGPNGAGKTTLVRALLGLLQPLRGKVIRRPGLTVGYLPQRIEIDPVLPLTVERLLTLTKRHPRSRLARALDEVGAPVRLLGQDAQVLSGGELQRVLLARALLRDPDLLVLDEPVQNVDVAGQVELYSLITRIRDAHGCGVLMVSHDLHIVMASTDRVFCVNRHVCCSGHPEAVSAHPEYLALFGAQAARTIAVYTHGHDHEHDLEGGVVPPQGTQGHPHPHGHRHHDHGAHGEGRG